MPDKMKLREIKNLTRQQVYDLFRKERISADSPRESHARSFPAGAGAYLWTNEALCSLENQLNLRLDRKDMLMVTCSGDPFATFAYLGAGAQVGFDTSHRATLWAELKLATIDKLSFSQFREFTGLDENPNPKAEKKYWQSVCPGLSDYAKNVFGELFRRHGTLRNVIAKGNFFRDNSCTGYFPRSNIYTASEAAYEKSRKALRENPPIIIPGTLDDALEMVEDKFGGFYGSNIIDHFKNPSGELDYSEATIAGFLRKVNSSLKDDAAVILQFEWSNYVMERAKSALESMGYSVKIAEHTGGYGRISVARRGR